jgi:hypothetical protein
MALDEQKLLGVIENHLEIIAGIKQSIKSHPIIVQATPNKCYFERLASG